MWDNMGYFWFAVWCFFLGLLIGFGLTHDHFSKAAFERGYMVQCVGMTGYYWERDE